jgi:hypothetical protein
MKNIKNKPESIPLQEVSTGKHQCQIIQKKCNICSSHDWKLSPSTLIFSILKQQIIIPEALASNQLCR